MSVCVCVYVVRHLLRARTSTSCAQLEAPRRGASRDAHDNTSILSEYIDTEHLLLAIDAYLGLVSDSDFQKPEIFAQEKLFVDLYSF